MEWKKCSLVLRSSKEIWQENERVRHLGEEMWLNVNGIGGCSPVKRAKE